jgi:GntR family transcriptional regulator/MocR family aminotransferase
LELLIVLDRSDARLLQVQLYDELRRMILSGVLKPVQKLPSSRQVAEQLSIARNTVVLAYERLVVEGYVNSKLKAGIFVNDKLPDASVLVRNGHSTVDSGKGRIRLGRIPPF